MPYPTTTWDEDAMGRPQAEGLSLTVGSMLTRSDRVDAEPLYTRVAVKRPKFLDVEFQMNMSQWRYFREFFEQTLLHGMKWFTMRLYLGVPADYTVHIDEYSVTWIADDLAALKMTIEVAR